MYKASIIALNIFIYFSFTTSETIDCSSGSKSCQEETKTCMPYQKCDIYCSEDKSCQSSTFNCPTNSSCAVTCDANPGIACQKATFNVYESQSASFLFGGEDSGQFQNGVVSCAKGSKCEIQCGTNEQTGSSYAQNMCNYATFYAKDASQLRVTAKGDHSLDTASIYCPEAGDCLIDIENGNEAMSHLKIYINDPSKVDLQISCPYTPHGNDGSNGCYAPGDPDLPVLYCDPVVDTYRHQCNFITDNGKDWHCSNRSSPCNTKSHWSNSTAPTRSPTLSPTNTTAAPTRSPTTPTRSPTQSPTGDTPSPTRSPTNNTPSPTHSPTTPTKSPTNSPTNTTPSPTRSPTGNTPSPTHSPTAPTKAPTHSPTEPTKAPTRSPTTSTNAPTHSPTNPTLSPSQSPTAPTGSPTNQPHSADSSTHNKKQNTLIIALVGGLAVLLIIAGAIWACKKYSKSGQGVDEQNLIGDAVNQ